MGSAKNTLKYQTVAPGVFIVSSTVNASEGSVPAGQEACLLVCNFGFSLQPLHPQALQLSPRLGKASQQKGGGPCPVWLTPLHLQLFILEQTVNSGVRHPHLVPAPQAMGRIEGDRSTCSMFITEPGSGGHSVNDHLSRRSSLDHR